MAEHTSASGPGTVPGHAARPVVPATWRALGDPSYITYRRHLLDAYLAWASPLMQGVVLDLGGKRDGKRGRFRPPTGAGAGSWLYVNIERRTQPHAVADASRIPLRTGAVDCVVCTEVLEHLPNPGVALAEIHRVLRPGGRLIASVPFLYPVHADPHDFQRFTAEGLRRLCGCFAEVDVLPMGGWLGTMGLLAEVRTWHDLGAWPASAARRRGLRAVARLLTWLDLRAGAADGGPWLPEFTSGYFVVARSAT